MMKMTTNPFLVPSAFPATKTSSVEENNFPPAATAEINHLITLITAKGPHLSPIMVKQGYLNVTTCHNYLITSSATAEMPPVRQNTKKPIPWQLSITVPMYVHVSSRGALCTTWTRKSQPDTSKGILLQQKATEFG